MFKYAYKSEFSQKGPNMNKYSRISLLIPYVCWNPTCISFLRPLQTITFQMLKLEPNRFHKKGI